MKPLYAEYALLCKALSDETRLKIIDMLSCGEMCACDILESFSISQSTLSYHMKILVECGLVHAVRSGAWMRYTLNTEKTNAFLEFFTCITSEKEECICNLCKKPKSMKQREDFIMKNIEIFDPAMCCSTGVCGPSIDSELLRIATVINSLKEQGIIIKRHGLSSEPQDFVSNKVIGDILQKEGPEILPVTLVDGQIAKTKEYPTNQEFSEWLGVEIASKQAEAQDDCCCCGSKGCC